MITVCPKCSSTFKGDKPCPACGWNGERIEPLKIGDLNGDNNSERFHPKIDYEGH